MIEAKDVWFFNSDTPLYALPRIGKSIHQHSLEAFERGTHHTLAATLEWLREHDPRRAAIAIAHYNRPWEEIEDGEDNWESEGDYLQTQDPLEAIGMLEETEAARN